MGNSLCELVLGLLNTRESAEPFQTFVRRFGKPNVFAAESGSALCHTFTDLGLSLYSIDQQIVQVQFHVKPINISSGTTSAYDDALPLGISVLDRRLDVQRKLGVPVESSHVNSFAADSYRSSSLHIICWYDPQTGHISELRVLKE